MNDTTKKQSILSLNANGTFPITYEAGAITVNLSQSRAINFWKHLSTLTTLEVRDAQNHIIRLKPMLDDEAKLLTYQLPKEVDRTRPMQLVMNHQPISEFIMGEDDVLAPTPKHALYQLVVSETRGLAKDLNPVTLLPYDRKQRHGFDRDKHGSITDLHTHSSSQVRAVDVVRSALELDREADFETDPNKAAGLYVTYPVELLKRLGTPPKATQVIHIVPSYEFKPMQYEGLECERSSTKDFKATHEALRFKDLTRAQRDAIIRAMDAEEDITKSFQNVERENYRHFNPLMKNPRLTSKMLRSMAEDYASRGIEYAEVATSSLLNPAWFEAMVKEVDAIEKGTLNKDGTRNDDAVTVGSDRKPFHMRFLVGLPRKFSPNETMNTLEKIKFLARHPYVVGIDLMGNETNKTSDFNWALSNIAMWARTSEGSDLKPGDGWNFKDDFIVRVHAGETAKNLRNVGEAVRIAHDHKVRVRIGHAQNADLDRDEVRMIAQMKSHEGLRDETTGEPNPKDWFGFEKCLDSNQFYRMRPLAHQVNVVEHARMANTTLGEDGNGMVHTSPRQQAFSALAAGMTLQDLEVINTYEKGYIARQMARNERKSRAYETVYPGGLDEFMRAYRAVDPKAIIDQRFAGKSSIVIGGESGSRWAKLDKGDQGQIEQMMEVLVRLTDPKKVYFVLGRVQNEGVSKALDIAVKRHNLKNPGNKFEVKARYAGANEQDPTGELPETVSGIDMIPGGQDAVVDATVDYAQREDAKCLFFGGGQFTSEIIQGVNDIDAGRLRWAAFLPKKSEVRARVQEVTNPKRHIMHTQDMIERIFRDVGPDEFFRDTTERDSMLRSNVQIDDAHYREQLLKVVREEWMKGQHVQRMPAPRDPAAFKRA